MLCFLCRRLLRWLDRDHAEWSQNRTPEWVEGSGEALGSWWRHGANTDDLFGKERDLERLGAAYDLLGSNRGEAIRELTILAEAGSVMAMVYLGWAFETGTRGDGDGVEAERWYRKACDAGSDEAMLRLGIRAYSRKNAAEVEAVLRPGFAKGVTPAMRYVALAQLRLVRTPEARHAARQLLECASERGDIAARLDLARARTLGAFGWRDVRPGLRAWHEAASDLISWLRAEHARRHAAEPGGVSVAEADATHGHAPERKPSASLPIAAVLFGGSPTVHAR